MHSLGIVLSVQFSVLWESEVAGEEAFDWDREKTIYEVTLLGQASPILAAYLTAHPSDPNRLERLGIGACATRTCHIPCRGRGG